MYRVQKLSCRYKEEGNAGKCSWHHVTLMFELKNIHVGYLSI